MRQALYYILGPLEGICSLSSLMKVCHKSIMDAERSGLCKNKWPKRESSGEECWSVVSFSASSIPVYTIQHSSSRHTSCS